jgi:hypothetical protein
LLFCIKKDFQVKDVSLIIFLYYPEYVDVMVLFFLLLYVVVKKQIDCLIMLLGFAWT